MGHQISLDKGAQPTNRSYPITTNKNSSIYNKRIEHQGLLKLRNVPFKNCIQIQNETTSFFLQNVDITLKDLLESRLYTNKLFPKQDVERLIQNVTYTLAFLQQNGIPYKDVNAENVYYDDGMFKLLPNQLISESTYGKYFNRVKKVSSKNQEKYDKDFIPLSPQMIIAFRCKQTQINDPQILDKSNVFYLGLLFLEVTTLLPSFECYDTNTCDILDQVITERLQMVKQYYSQQIASIIANMLDYDYVERVNLKQASIFINRQLNKQSQQKIRQTPKKHQSHQIISQPSQSESKFSQSNIKQSKFSKNRIYNAQQNQSEVIKPCKSRQKLQKRKNKTNKIYMNDITHQQYQEQCSKQQKNKVYMKSSQIRRHTQSVYTDNDKPTRISSDFKPQISTNTTSLTPSRLRQNGVLHNRTNNIYGQKSSYNHNNQKYTYPPAQYAKKESNRGFNMVNNEQDDENNRPYEDQSFKKNLRRKNSSDYLGYRANANVKSLNQAKYLQRNINKEEKYHLPPKQLNFGEKYENNQHNHNYLENSNYSEESRNYYESREKSTSYKLNNTFKEHDHSLSRIKSEIQKSRKLIEEFKKGQNCHF